MEILDRQELYIFLDVFIASVLTMLVGVEREKASKAAGIRTNMIVGGFTCLMVSLIDPLIGMATIEHADQIVKSDPIRVLQAIVVGVSFIGAGTIIKSKEESKVTGLTTAATLLYSIGVGMSVAVKNYLLAVLLTLFILLINRVIKYLMERFTDIKN